MPKAPRQDAAAAAAETSKKKTRSGGRRRKTREKPLELKTRDDGLRALLLVMAKLLHKTSRATAVTMSLVCDTFLLTSDCQIVAAQVAETESFNKAVEAWRSERDKALKAKVAPPPPWGAPGPIMAMALLTTLAEQDVGANNRQQLETWTQEGEMDQQAFADKFPHCRLDGTASKETEKLAISTTHPSRPALLNAIEQVGGRRLHGPPPPGYMEDEIGDWISYLEGALE